MEGIERRIADFEISIREIIQQFQKLHASLVNAPHVNLGPHDMGTIEYLGESGPQMMRAIAERLGLAVNSVTPIVDSLERKDLVIRTRSESDRRVVNVELTEEGLRAYEQATMLKRQFHLSLLNALTVEEQELLIVLFRKIAREGVKQVSALEPHTEPNSDATK